MESAPNGRIYFSDAQANLRGGPGLRQAGAIGAPEDAATAIGEGTDLDIGQPKRIIEVEPVSLPLPEAISAPDPRTASVPEPAEPAP